MGKKANKAGDFQDTAQMLLSSLGGNRTAPVCGTSKIDIVGPEFGKRNNK